MPRSDELSQSKWITSDTQIVEGKIGLFRGVLLTAGDVDASISVYDGTSTSDEQLFTIKVKAGTTMDVDMVKRPLGYKVGIYTNLKGAGSKALIWYT
jgi:hypothetical protein